MQSENKILDDLARLAAGAAGTLGDVKTEIEARLRDYLDRLLTRMDLVTREEFEAVKALAAAAREENERLSARLVALEGAVTSVAAAPAKGRARPKAAGNAKSGRATGAKKAATPARSSKSKRR